MGLPELTGDISGMAGMSPKSIAGILTLRLYEKYFDFMAEKYGIDGAISTLLCSCPEEDKRDQLWDKYFIDRGEDGENALSAATYALGGWYQYMSFAMGLTEKFSDTSTVGMSPKNITGIAALRLYEKYFDFMVKNYGIDGAISTLLCSSPDEKKRKELWGLYIGERDKRDNKVSASVHALGGWYQYMSSAMGLTEQSRGGW